MDDREHIARVYEAHGCDRLLSDETAAMWTEVFARHAPLARPLTVVDVDAGTGQLTPALARAFGGPVFGIEPHDHLRENAIEVAAHADVTYLEGSAARIPLPARSCDLVVAFPLWHQIRDPEDAVTEIARVLRRGGRVMLRAWFGDRLPQLPWHTWHRRARAIEEQTLPTLSTVTSRFAEVGLRRIAVERVRQTVASGLPEYAEDLWTRPIRAPQHMSNEEASAGWKAMDQAAVGGRAEPVYEDYDLLILG